MRLVFNNPTLDCGRMEKPPFTHPDITPLTTVTEYKQYTNEHKVTWDEYHLQEAVIFHGRAAIVAAVMPEYIEEKEVDYLGYSMESILSLIAHLQTSPAITDAERMAAKASFVAPWSDSPDQHISAYVWDLTRRQNNATKYDVKITDDDKVTQLIACIYEADILEDSVMEKWEKSGDRSWTATVKHFVKEYRVFTRASERAAQRAGYESTAAFREDDRPPSKISHVPPYPDPPQRTMTPWRHMWRPWNRTNKNWGTWEEVVARRRVSVKPMKSPPAPELPTQQRKWWRRCENSRRRQRHKWSSLQPFC